MNRLVLLGLPGAGASTVGRLLAGRWRVPLCDSDREVERALGAGLGEIIVEAGEQAFRQAEKRVVLRALDALRGEPGVLVVGGGAVADPDVVTAIHGCAAAVAFLDVSPARAARRLGLQGGAAVGLGNPRATWQRLAESRRRACAAVASVHVLTDELTADRVADRVAARLAEEADPG